MEWRALPPVDWWIVIGGVLWSIFWVTVVYLLLSTLAYLRGRINWVRAGPLQLAEQPYASGEIGHDEFERARRDPRDTPVGFR